MSFPKARVQIYDVGIFMSCCSVLYKGEKFLVIEINLKARALLN